jgi:cytochrome c peroxidase
VQKYNDLPAAFATNLDTQLPLDGRAAHSEPPMSEHDIADLISFLRTLTDADQQAATPMPAGSCTE